MDSCSISCWINEFGMHVQDSKKYRQQNYIHRHKSDATIAGLKIITSSNRFIENTAFEPSNHSGKIQIPKRHTSPLPFIPIVHHLDYDIIFCTFP